MTQPQLITLTDNAAAHIKSLIAEAPADQKILGVRIGVTATGCSGMSYSLEYATTENPLDIAITEKDIKIYVDSKAQLYVAGMEMDYHEDKFESGFVFNNPNAAGHCGCGKSFRT